MDQSDDQIFDRFLSAAIELMLDRLQEDPKVGIDVQRDRGCVRGLIRSEGGQSLWWLFEVESERVRREGPEVVADDFIEGLREVRRNHPLLAGISPPLGKTDRTEGGT